jgi:hypothetical protein
MLPNLEFDLPLIHLHQYILQDNLGYDNFSSLINHDFTMNLYKLKNKKP